MENLMRLCTKTIRVSYCDPDATDSSSDDESDKFQKKSKRKVIEGEVEFVEKIQNEGTGFKKPNLTSEGEKMVGIRKMKSGKFWAEIRDPIKKRWVWLGIFGTAEAATRAYLAEESKIAAAELRAKKPVPKTAGNKIVGVRMRKSGKFSAEIRNPITKRRVWLGTFDTEEEASRSYLAKKAHFEAEKLKAKRRLDRVGSEKSSAPDSVSSDLSNETVGENKVSRDQEAEFGVFNGVQVVDKNGFLVGEFSMLDDLSIFSVGEDDNS